MRCRDRRELENVKLLTQFNAVSSLREKSFSSISRSDETLTNCVSNFVNFIPSLRSLHLILFLCVKIKAKEALGKRGHPSPYGL